MVWLGGIFLKGISFYATQILSFSVLLGDDRCSKPETNLTVHFLVRDNFPNGPYQNLWEERNVKETCMKKWCFALHNNWISGKRKKTTTPRVIGALGI